MLAPLDGAKLGSMATRRRLMITSCAVISVPQTRCRVPTPTHAVVHDNKRASAAAAAGLGKLRLLMFVVLDRSFDSVLGKH
mmetsp:Transcript_7040/g.15790  ORF Transcript_7040/g.15790 Transcript_7040/m.15790 type:complete len:81 (-) Transcript_7040:429-671(-)